MINIVFLLLLYFLLAGQLMATSGPEVRLPLGGATGQAEPAATVVMLDASGGLWVGARQLTEPGLRQHLVALVRDSAAAGVLIRADGRADADALQVVLEACRTAGVREIRLATIEGG
jgi:biopolymer transport protein ExbD